MCNAFAQTPRMQVSWREGNKWRLVQEEGKRHILKRDRGSSEWVKSSSYYMSEFNALRRVKNGVPAACSGG